MPSSNPVSWNEVLDYCENNTDELHKQMKDKSVSIDLYISFVKFVIQTDRFIFDKKEGFGASLPSIFKEITNLAMTGVRRIKNQSHKLKRDAQNKPIGWNVRTEKGEKVIEF